MVRRYEPIDQQTPDGLPVHQKGKKGTQEEERDEEFERKFISTKKQVTPVASHRRYPEPPLDSEVAARIEHLRAITSSIEARLLMPVNLDLPDTPLAARFRKELNEAQLLVATYTDGPLLVIAGAGSGKTRALTYRAAWLIEKGVPAEEILLLTFTRRAAEEMARRAVTLIGKGDEGAVTTGTFHSFAAMLLRRYATAAGISPDFTIADRADAEDIIDLIRRELRLDAKGRSFPRKGAIEETLSRARLLDISLEEAIVRFNPSLEPFAEEFARIGALYTKFKTAHRILDYDDLLETLWRALRDSAAFLTTVQDRWRYLMVDEFQDTDLIQKRIVDLIAARERNIVVVGDDAQSIYSFRGANFENILRFPETYPDCRVVRIERNYRSTQPILDLANAVIGSARIGYPKRLFSETPSLERPFLRSFTDPESEASFICEEIQSLLEQVSPSDIAVLYRAAFHSNFIQAELIRRGIPFVVYGGLKFVERRHIKDLVAYLRIVQNPLDAVAWNRVLMLLPGIGNTTAGQVIERVRAQEETLFVESFKGRRFYPYLAALTQALTAARASGGTPFRALSIVKEHYLPLLQMLEPDWEERLRDIEILERIAARYEEIGHFLSDFALEPPSRHLAFADRPPEENEEEPVVLSTVHSAKGLEWHTVFVPHLLDGLFPAARSCRRIDDLEEERRLFYVACSRAKRRLYLTFPAAAFWGGALTLPSRFIAGLDEELYEC